MVGAYTIDNILFGIVIMLTLGALAFIMEENGLPVAPAILGLVLGPMPGGNFLTSMIKAGGDLIATFERPLATSLGAVTLLLQSTPVVQIVLRRARPAAAGRCE